MAQQTCLQAAGEAERCGTQVHRVVYFGSIGLESIPCSQQKPSAAFRATDRSLDFIAPLAAPVSKSRVNVTRFDGMFAPRQQYREPVAGASAERPFRHLRGVTGLA